VAEMKRAELKKRCGEKAVRSRLKASCGSVAYEGGAVALQAFV